MASCRYDESARGAADDDERHRLTAVQGLAALLELGQTPKPPVTEKTLVVVPVASLSLSDDVIAVTVCFTDPEDEAVDVSFRDRWEQWHPNVPLITLQSAHRALGPPIVKYLRQLEIDDRYQRLVVLIPEVQPKRFWYYLLFNQRGVILDRAIRRGTTNVVLCRLRYRLDQIAPGAPVAPVAAPAGSLEHG